MKSTVIYHSADFDGIFCREIARKFLQYTPVPPTGCACGVHQITYLGWDFRDPKIPMPGEGTVYILDLSPDCLEAGLGTVIDPARLVWIDHHKTAIEKYDPSIPGYRIDGVSACRLTWQWFTDPDAENYRGRAWSGGSKEAFLERSVKEPIAVRLAGEYDVWDHRGDGDLQFQFGLRSLEPDFAALLNDQTDVAESYTKWLVDRGQVVMDYVTKNDRSICEHNTFLLEWEGLRWLCINTARFNSNFFAARDVRETGHDALLGFTWTGKTWLVSLYHAAHNKEIDLSEIAKKYGGGGHRGACGFSCKTLPLPL